MTYWADIRCPVARVEVNRCYIQYVGEEMYPNCIFSDELVETISQGVQDLIIKRLGFSEPVVFCEILMEVLAEEVANGTKDL